MQNVDLALEIQNIYRDTSSKVYSRYYKDLASKISKLQVIVNFLVHFFYNFSKCLV